LGESSTKKKIYMTQRLPIPGGDNGDWGNILNGYLEVSLSSTGTLNSNVVGTSQIASNAVTNAQLDVPTQTILSSVASKYVKPGGGIPATDLASAVQTNLSSASTALQSSYTLSGGDLTGTIATPTVSKVRGVTVSTPTGGTTSYLNASGTWTTPSGGGNMNTSTYDPAGIAQQVVGTTATQTLTNKSISGGQITSAVANATTATATNGLNTATTTVVINGATAPTSGQVLTASSATLASWVNPTSGGGASALTPTAVMTSAYTASPGDFVPVDTSSNSVTITLPTAPADKSRIEIKMINTASGNIVTFNAGGSDVLNKSGGNTSGTLNVLNQAVLLQYTSATAIWYVQSDDLPQTSVVMGSSHTVTSTYTMTGTDHVVMADATGGGFTITLPTAVGFSGRYTIDAVTSTTNVVTLSTTSSQTIDGSSSTTLGTGASGAYWTSVDLVSDGANWHTV
jgi:hypothetical protein